MRLGPDWRVAVMLMVGCWMVAPAVAQVSPGPLARAHRDLEGTLKCTSCHAAGKTGMDSRCTTCHREIGWLADRERGLHGLASTKAATCASCHPDHAGADFALIKWPGGSERRFDHASVGFPLRQSHVEAECDDCHAPKYRLSEAARLAPAPGPRWTGLEAGCATCHADPHRGALGTSCTDCHDAGKWEATPGFKHDTTDYPLTGRHRDVKCEDCHATTALVTARDGRGQPIPVYRPVPHQSCASCHRDPHGGTLGAGCSDCHSTEGFGRISGNGFDHSRTGYPLRGRHAAVRCAACHQDFSGPNRRPSHATCATCHAPDPHLGKATLGGKAVDCAECHSERSFKPSALARERHQDTKYPLEGKHLSVSCDGCHRTDKSPTGRAAWGTAAVVLRPQAARCLDCHQDPHGKELSTGDGAKRCDDCHQVVGWAPSRFDRAAHAKLRLPLDGRHAEVPCAACHGAKRTGLPAWGKERDLGKAGFAFKDLSVDCASCHLDPHQGRFAASGAHPSKDGCRTCHSAAAFAPTTVDVTAHAGFSFPLEGAHRATPCSSCHQDLANRPAGGSTLLEGGAAFTPLKLAAPPACAECHQNPHGSQFQGRADRGSCEGCHDASAFAPAGRFDHDRGAAFKLEGAHRAAACGACHRPAANGTVIYRPLSSKCESCHAT